VDQRDVLPMRGGITVRQGMKDASATDSAVIDRSADAPCPHCGRPLSVSRPLPYRPVPLAPPLAARVFTSVPTRSRA